METNFRSYDGYTPVGDIARLTGRAKSTVQSILDSSGGTTVVREVPTWNNRRSMGQLCILSKDVPALMSLVNSSRKYERRKGSRSRRWRMERAPVRAPQAEPAEAKGEDNAVELVRTLRKLKLLCEALGINMNEITFEDGKAKFPRIKEEVITL